MASQSHILTSTFFAVRDQSPQIRLTDQQSQRHQLVPCFVSHCCLLLSLFLITVQSTALRAVPQWLPLLQFLNHSPLFTDTMYSKLLSSHTWEQSLLSSASSSISFFLCNPSWTIPDFDSRSFDDPSSRLSHLRWHEQCIFITRTPTAAIQVHSASPAVTELQCCPHLSESLQCTSWSSNLSPFCLHLLNVAACTSQHHKSNAESANPAT